MRDFLSGLAAFVLIPSTVLCTCVAIKLWQTGLVCKRLGHDWRYGAWHKPRISDDADIWYRVDSCTRCSATNLYHAKTKEPAGVV